jgi:hypothetical protein
VSLKLSTPGQITKIITQPSSCKPNTGCHKTCCLNPKLDLVTAKHFHIRPWLGIGSLQKGRIRLPALWEAVSTSKITLVTEKCRWEKPGSHLTNISLLFSFTIEKGTVQQAKGGLIRVSNIEKWAGSSSHNHLKTGRDSCKTKSSMLTEIKAISLSVSIYNGKNPNKSQRVRQRSCNRQNIIAVPQAPQTSVAWENFTYSLSQQA